MLKLSILMWQAQDSAWALIALWGGEDSGRLDRALLPACSAILWYKCLFVMPT